MNFREIISNFYPLLHNKKNKIFMFFIGSYPHSPDKKHEIPKALKNFSKLEVSIHRIYIDSCYEIWFCSITCFAVWLCILIT